MFEPPPAAANQRELVEREADAIAVELKRIEQRLAALSWEAVPSRPAAGKSWQDFALGRPRVHDDGGLPHQVLTHKRESLLLRLAELRASLPGQPRKGRW